MVLKFIKTIISYLKQPKAFVTGIDSGYLDLPYRALLYHKIEPFINPTAVKDYNHVNLWEITEAVSILNRSGFVVDIIDRSANDFLPEDKYDIFIGLGTGNSGKHFAKYAKNIPKAIKILWATGAEPIFSNQLCLQQYKRFHDRTGFFASPMRLRDNIDFNEIVKYIDYIFITGEIDQFSGKSYRKYQIPHFSILPGTSPKLRFSPYWLKTRKRNHFLCFAGNGFIYKGVDLVVEAFLKMPECHVTICGPNNEKAFFDTYGTAIAKSPNIKYEGFLKIGGKRFEEICSECSFIIFYSASESCATSVASVMRAGLVPVINPETGINVGNFGFLMTNKDDRIGDIMNTVQKVILMEHDEYTRRVYETLLDSIKFTQSSFTESFTRALLNVMQREMNYQKK